MQEQGRGWDGGPVILNLGMGVESSALLARILLEPGCREGLGLGGPGGLARLVVVTAMTGDEFPDTGRLVEEHLLPLMRAQGVRYVQLARAGSVKVAGRNVAVLDDSTAPERVHLAGRFKLSDEMLAAGTVPAMGGTKKCSIKAKGEPIDAWLADTLGNEAGFSQMIGFNAGEAKRKADDLAAQAERAADGFLPGRRGVFPLIDWGWDRARCLEYLRGVFGVEWLKSACVFCPFSRGKAEVLARYRADPQSAAFALWVEHVALALNPRMALFAEKSLRSVLEKDGNEEALRLFAGMLAGQGAWAVYRVRRLYRSAGLADRNVEVLAEGTQAETAAELRLLAAQAGVEAQEEAGSLRAWLRRKEAGVVKTSEEMLVALPLVPESKAARGWSEEKWEARVSLPVAGALAGCAA